MLDLTHAHFAALPPPFGWEGVTDKMVARLQPLRRPTSEASHRAMNLPVELGLLHEAWRPLFADAGIDPWRFYGSTRAADPHTLGWFDSFSLVGKLTDAGSRDPRVQERLPLAAEIVAFDYRLFRQRPEEIRVEMEHKLVSSQNAKVPTWHIDSGNYISRCYLMRSAAPTWFIRSAAPGLRNVFHDEVEAWLQKPGSAQFRLQANPFALMLMDGGNTAHKSDEPERPVVSTFLHVEIRIG